MPEGKNTMISQPLGRRAALGMLAGTAAAGAAGAAGAGDAIAVPWSAGSERPTLLAPPGAADCHHHIYDHHFPADPAASLHPGDATVADYRLLQRRLGTTRNVVVQPSTYGTDNRCMLAALAAFGATARGIAVVHPDIPLAELRRMNEAGVRGIRFNLVQAGATTIEMVEPLSRRIAAFGWHVQIHMKGPQIVEAAEIFRRLPTPVVFDHLARIPEPEGVNSPAFATLRALLDRGHVWVKLSGAYQDSRIGPPRYADITPLARAYVKAAPERLVWGSDWPHPTEKVKPDDAVLFDLLADWAPEAATRTQILVKNPEILYGFS